MVPSAGCPARGGPAPHGRRRSYVRFRASAEENRAPCGARRARRPDGAVRRLGHAGRVQRHLGRAPRGARAGRALRRQPHGRGRDCRGRRPGRGPENHQQRRLPARSGADPVSRRCRRPTAPWSTTCSSIAGPPEHFLLVINAGNIAKDCRLDQAARSPASATPWRSIRAAATRSSPSRARRRRRSCSR